MTALFRSIAASLVFLLAVCSPALATSDRDLVGLWYGEGYQPMWDREAQWMAERRPDGTFEIEFRIVYQCQVEHRQVETGHWTVVDETLRAVTETIDGVILDVPLRQDYVIEEFGGDQFRYRHVRTGIEFSARRVQAGFTIPGCVS